MNLEKLASEFKNGNQKAFDAIYKETLPYVRLAIYTYVQDKYIIEDLIQDTYMKVNSNISKYLSTSFNNWIYTIAKNTALDYVRKKKEERIEDVSYIPDKVSHPYLNYAINHLDEIEKEVFLMKVLCGFTTKKISETLVLKIKEVNNIYYRAKDKLKRELEGITNEIK